MYELKTEREQLMQKVDAQSNYIKKADATAKAQANNTLGCFLNLFASLCFF
jgi:hypothetical protein